MPEDQERLFGGGICASCGRNGNGQNRIIPRGRRRTPVLREASTHSQHCNRTNNSTRIYVEINIYIYMSLLLLLPLLLRREAHPCVHKSHAPAQRMCALVYFYMQVYM